MNSKARSIDIANDDPQETLSRARTLLHHSVDAAREAVDDVRNEVADQVQEAATGVRQSAKKAGRAVGTAFRDAKAALRESYDTGRRQLRELKETGSSYVQDHPGRALVSALAVGLIAGAVCGSLATRKLAPR